MNGIFRWITAMIFGLVIAYAIRTKDDAGNTERENPKTWKYGAIISPNLLMSSTFLLFVLAAVIPDRRFSFESVFALVCGIFISIAVFFALFILLLPVLRKHVSAKTLALLWLLPDLLCITVQEAIALDKPRLVLDIGNSSFRTVSRIWIAAAAVIFMVYVVRHFIFRFKLLRHANPVEAGMVRTLWENMQTEYEFKKPCVKIVTSENTSTPLSIGLFRRTTVLVLPHTDYTEAELKLIFKHELIHIIRSDCQTKLFIAFCNAVCWFNPLMWIAMKKCAEDLELSCDEYVVENCNKADKDLYGDLILSVVGNEAGFTSCLSANADALKYRLTSIYKPKRRFGGSMLVGVLLVIMLLTSGNIALSYNHQTVADVFYGNVNEAAMDKNSLTVADEYRLKNCSCNDPEALSDYIMNLKVYEITGIYESRRHEMNYLSCQYQTEKGAVYIAIEDDVLKYRPLYKDGFQDTNTYYLEESVDWEYMKTIISAVS